MPMAGGCGCRCHPCLDRQLVSAPDESRGQRPADRRAVANLRAAHLERVAHAAKPAVLPLCHHQWLAAGVTPDRIEGLNLPDARKIKQTVAVPVLCTGGFQTASVIRDAITRGDCDGVSIARPLVANNDLVKQFEAGKDRADKPCTYCNKCLVHVVEHPLGCYEESRFASREEMMAQVMSVFSPPPFA